jgi:hypothetical protein
VPPVLIRDLKLTSPFMVGDDVWAMRRAGLKFMREPASKLTTEQQQTFGPGMKALMVRCQDEAVQRKDGVGDNELLAAFRRAGVVDRRGDFLLKKHAALHPARKVPDLGPIYRGGRSLLLQDLTHETDGIDGFPAFDDGWRAGRVVIAPERLTVTVQSGSQGGDAFFARGDSKIEYWIGHLTRSPANGTVFAKGATMSQIAAIPASQGGPHVHTGINAKPLCGFELLHHTNYTHGAPTVGEQLRKWAHG